MNIKRIAKHLTMTHWQVSRTFTRRTLTIIEQSIKRSETAHVGEIRFVVEGALDGMPLFTGQTARERAIDVFSQLRMWDTEYNNGVLIYLLYADRDVEIIADRGIHSKVHSREWTKICRQMETAFKQGNYEGGVINGIQAVTASLAEHFPAAGNGRNELSNKPMVL
ncbi:TPM domain-containing protein [Undibacterium sp. RTI2.1]|uniref:TPM domain-containing protein n=1 Tax=unclassified Undibacterium TaxID=2630295 RepID=UPI002B23AAB6|nr:MULTISPECIES: TPM domain-containing protein [unclassified Undibacterium]MEB0032177.1 TPM domain-containing protein [Undibacterium sp. RTI2.1]MEB0118292.1 TPM domain-containing protein [Undibacterium sp. RTI2.2]